MTKVMEKTAEEIEELKRQWLVDPCWDIEDTEGFEAHREGLAKYRKEVESNWTADRMERIAIKAKALNCSVELAEHIMQLEQRIMQLEQPER